MSRTRRKKTDEQVWTEKETRKKNQIKQKRRKSTKTKLREIDYNNLDSIDEEEFYE